MDRDTAATFAYTRAQLLSQLSALGYGEGDLATVDRAHTYARELFAGAFRASGKPFLCHLVGTASLLAAFDASPAVVAAGLLHAAYPLGNFGAGWLGTSELKRTQVRARMGEAIESLIHRYDEHPWRDDTPALLIQQLAHGKTVDRSVITMRLANEVEDHRALDILYCRNASQRLERLRRLRPVFLDLARRIDQQRLGELLDAVVVQCLAAQVPESLQSRYDHAFAQPTISRTRWWLQRLLMMVAGRAG